MEQRNKMMATIKSTNYLLKTRLPFNLLLLCLIIIILTIESIFNPVWTIYSIPICGIFYAHFCRYCCVVLISKQDFIIYYIVPWNKTVIIKIENIARVDYQKGFYDLSSTKPIGGVFNFPQYCYDRLIIYLNDPKKSIVYLNVNTRMCDFDKILKLPIQLKLMDKL
jgi:hypothetical protein